MALLNSFVLSKPIYLEFNNEKQQDSESNKLFKYQDITYDTFPIPQFRCDSLASFQLDQGGNNEDKNTWHMQFDFII